MPGALALKGLHIWMAGHGDGYPVNRDLDWGLSSGYKTQLCDDVIHWLQVGHGHCGTGVCVCVCVCVCVKTLLKKRKKKERKKQDENIMVCPIT